MASDPSAAPTVSVVLSVYNAERHLRGAVNSILDQTLSDFEFIIIDDGSTDDTGKILGEYRDPRIRLISRENRGLTHSLNEGVLAARGKYVARMDADDVSVSTRFAKQVEFLDANPHIGVVGSNYTIIDENGRPLLTTDFFTHPDELRTCLVLCNQIGHGSVMVRKEVIVKAGMYDATVGIVEDYDLWQRISGIGELANLPDVLYLWRHNPQGVSLANDAHQLRLAHDLRDRAFDRFLAVGGHRLWSFHPRSLRGGPKAYLRKKSLVFCDFAYLYRRHGMIPRATIVMVGATICAPFTARNYKYLLFLVRDSWFKRWEYYDV